MIAARRANQSMAVPRSGHAMLFVLALLAALTPMTLVQASPPPLGPAAWTPIDAPIKAPTTRDLVIAYRTVERQLGAGPFDPELARRANRVLDDVAIAFFQRDLRTAFKLLRIEHDALLAADIDPRAFALRVRTPGVVVAEAEDHVQIPIVLDMAWLIGRYPWPLQIAFEAPDGQVWKWGPTHDRQGPEPTGFRTRVTLPRIDGTWTVRLVSDDVVLWEDECAVLPRSARTIRSEIESELATLEMPEEIRHALERRAALLTDADAMANAGGALLPPSTLWAELQRDLAVVRSGRSPFAATDDAAQDRWISLPAGAVEVPGRLVVPPSSADDALPPLVIALHGAGGNEHLFVEGYGAGEIAQLARDRGFVLFSARTYTMMGSRTVFPALLDALEAVCAFDRERVVIIGHSLGAITAQALGSMHPKEIAAVAAIAGGPLPNGTLPPTLVWVAERDRIVPPGPALQRAQRRAADGEPVEARLAAEQGHALVVAVVVREAVAWLLDRAGTITP